MLQKRSKTGLNLNVSICLAHKQLKDTQIKSKGPLEFTACQKHLQDAVSLNPFMSSLNVSELACLPVLLHQI